MNWIKFALWLLGIYTVYYTVLICWDYFRSQRGNVDDDQHELSFVEEFAPSPALVEELSTTGKESSVFSSGGVSLKQLFNLAREESVEYVKAVSF